MVVILKWVERFMKICPEVRKIILVESETWKQAHMSKNKLSIASVFDFLRLYDDTLLKVYFKTLLTTQLQYLTMFLSQCQTHFECHVWDQYCNIESFCHFNKNLIILIVLFLNQILFGEFCCFAGVTSSPMCTIHFNMKCHYLKPTAALGWKWPQRPQ